ncbi:hypothetical protein IWX49DRAFT_349262 [Phyllosticta citricarpa]
MRDDSNNSLSPCLSERLFGHEEIPESIRSHFGWQSQSRRHREPATNGRRLDSVVWIAGCGERAYGGSLVAKRRSSRHLQSKPQVVLSTHCCLAVLARGQRARVPQQPDSEMLQILHDDCRPHFCVSGETSRLVWLVRVSVRHRTHRKRHVASESLQPALSLMHIMYLVGCRNQSCMNPPLPKKDCFLGSLLPSRRAEPRDIRSRERQLRSQRRRHR